VELSVFGLAVRPFPLTRDPAFLWAGPPYEEALAALRAAVLERRGLVLLTGEVGAGKSTVVNGLVASLAGTATIVGRMSNPKPDPWPLFRVLADMCGLPAPTTREAVLTAFEGFLSGAAARGHRQLLVIDDARSLSTALRATIEELVAMGERAGRGDGSLLTVLVVGDGDADGPPSTSEWPAVQAHCHLRTLTETEVGQYIVHQLQIAGTEQEVFSREAVQKIWAFSAGRPGLINMSAYRALVATAEQGKSLVEPSVIDGYAETLGASTTRGRSEDRLARRPRRAAERSSRRAAVTGPAVLVGAGLLVLAVIVAGYWHLRAAPTRAGADGGRPGAASASPATRRSVPPLGSSAPTGPAPAPTTAAPAPSSPPAAATVAPPVEAPSAAVPSPSVKPSPPVTAPDVERRRPPARDESAAASPRVERAPQASARPPVNPTEPDPAGIIDWLIEKGPGRGQAPLSGERD
jgi:general secretion pathway protein A